MPDGQNQGPDVASSAAAESPAREPVLVSLDADPAEGGGDSVAGIFAPAAGFADLHGAGPGQTPPIVAEPWP